tara:strand:- start:2 stop:550 length:549 start_codon:yes stop_codon:yes gene_type:complete
MDIKAFYKAVSDVQQELKAPKNQFNKFGKYNYRNCEDILEGFKKIPSGLVLTVSDDVIEVSGRIYVKSTATLTDGENSISTNAMARESESKKGMDDSQITGTASSYARKYALNGLLCIDDSKDADSLDNTGGKPKQEKINIRPSSYVVDDLAKQWINIGREDINNLNELTDPDYRKFIEGKL